MNVLDLDLPEWEEAVLQKGWKKYRARQIFDWLHRKLIQDPQNMTNLPIDTIDWLQKNFEFFEDYSSVITKSMKDQSQKMLYFLPEIVLDNGAQKIKTKKKEMETIYLPHKTWNSICLSTQSGCSLNCQFCASGQIPFKGNLSVGEIIYPVYDIIRKNNKKINNIVFMGMGEPFYNYENTIKAARILSRQEGIGIGVKKIAVSTSGVLPGIEKFIRDEEPFALALSLHFFDHEKRKVFMDIEEKYPINDVIQYLIDHKSFFNRKSIMLEYIHFPEINDSEREAKKLGELGKVLGARINLVPYNGKSSIIEDFKLKKPSRSESVDFQNKIKKYFKMVFIRNSAGEDIEGACGMLAGSYLKIN